MEKEEKLNQMIRWMEERQVDSISVYPFIVNNTVIYSLSFGNDGLVYEDCDSFNNPLVEEKTIDILHEMMNQQWELRHLNELSVEEIESLLKQIVFGSMYYSDFRNDLGVSMYEVSYFTESFTMYVDSCIQESIEHKEDNPYKAAGVWQWFDNASTKEIAEEFHYYLQDTENELFQSIYEKYLHKIVQDNCGDWDLHFRPTAEICGDEGLAVFNSIKCA